MCFQWLTCVFVANSIVNDTFKNFLLQALKIKLKHKWQFDLKSFFSIWKFVEIAVFFFNKIHLQYKNFSQPIF